jgi:hypothetical protein
MVTRKFRKSLDFIGVLEFQENGNAHLHVLLGQYIPQKWLSIAWQSIGGGKIMDIRQVHVHRVSAYLSVYLTGEKVVRTLKLLPMRVRILHQGVQLSLRRLRQSTQDFGNLNETIISRWYKKPQSGQGLYPPVFKVKAGL